MQLSSRLTATNNLGPAGASPNVRPPRSDDWKMQPLAAAVGQALQKDTDAVLPVLDTLADSALMSDRVQALQGLVGQGTWTPGTFVKVAHALDQARRDPVALPGATGPSALQRAVHMLEGLSRFPSRQFTTTQDLQALGYSAEVAEKLLQQAPALVQDLARWCEVDPAQAAPRELYRAMALPGGMAGYDPEKVGNLNGEMYFADSERGALSFGVKRVQHTPGAEGVMLHTQVPRFMVETSPPQGWDAVYPILRERNMPDPDRPDIRLFVARQGSFDANSVAVHWA